MGELLWKVSFILFTWTPCAYLNCRLHIHPTSGHPAAIPELHLVYRDGNDTFNHEQLNRISSTLWHSDVSYELQPPGLTTFFLLAQRTCFQHLALASDSTKDLSSIIRGRRHALCLPSSIPEEIIPTVYCLPPNTQSCAFWCTTSTVLSRRASRRHSAQRSG